MTKTSRLPYLIVGLLALIIALTLLLFSPSTIASEIAEMKKSKTTDQKIALYQKLIDRVGPVEAQEELYRSGLPFTGETHLINHLSGDYLYKQDGVAGILLCKDYFLSSCYHGLLLNVIAKEGLESLSDAMEICYKKGSTTASQCAHGIGHGLLAWIGYKKLPEAVELCEALREKNSRFPLFNCEDGVFMENLWAVHDNGLPSPDRWIREDDPFYPCSDPRIKPEWQNACWSNQPSVLYQAFKGDLKKTGEWCGKAPLEQRAMCFDGLARQIHPLTEGGVEKTFALCNLLPQTEQSKCAITIATADYAVGGRKTSFEICLAMPTTANSQCFQDLYSMMRAYRQEESSATLCKPIIESTRREECLTALEK